MWTHYLTTKTQDILVWMGWILLYSHVILSQIIMLSLRLWFFTPAFIENIVSGEDLSIIFFDCISAEAVFETYPHMVRICFFCIDKCSVSQREWWIQTPHLSLRSCQSKPNKTRFWVIHTWKVMLHFAFSLLSRICQKRFIQLHSTLPKNMINTICVVVAKSVLRTINSSHFHEDYVCG